MRHIKPLQRTIGIKRVRFPKYPGHNTHNKMCKCKKCKISHNKSSTQKKNSNIKFRKK